MLEGHSLGGALASLCAYQLSTGCDVPQRLKERGKRLRVGPQRFFAWRNWLSSGLEAQGALCDVGIAQSRGRSLQEEVQCGRASHSTDLQQVGPGAMPALWACKDRF